MSVIVSYPSAIGVETNYLACVKGSPEVLKSMLLDSPLDYDDAYLYLARRGARILSLGIKQLGQLSRQQVREISREQVECNLSFCGFVVLSCSLKPDSFAVIQQLFESNHHVKMITGDNPLTACHVSSFLRITRQATPTLVLTPPNPIRELFRVFLH
ncbi:unnamed protein product [Protopolystoma xenopodis]|uniref:Uncharacterized protein n=1 Tax=Protopolystoma xenopodis TaxID=117903 RepID=A0A3S5AAF9_9PLAT|nr:unnamed protein product [Protopolystoma xenopodis]